MFQTEVVILCGGKGTRLREQTEEIPKPLVEIGGMPIVWHIMKSYAHYGFKNFVLCLGYKGEKIKDFFINFYYRAKTDFVIENGQYQSLRISNNPKSNDVYDWKIIFAETGIETNTGGRIKKIQPYIHHETFFVTYGDGLANINFIDLLNYHKKHKKIATMTCIQPYSQFGIVEIGNNNLIRKYHEKPRMKEWVNGGFFVFNKQIFSMIKNEDILEQEPMRRFEEKKQIVGYPFDKFWACMDTYKDSQKLNDLWNSSNPPWKIWNE